MLKVNKRLGPVLLGLAFLMGNFQRTSFKIWYARSQFKFLSIIDKNRAISSSFERFRAVPVTTRIPSSINLDFKRKERLPMVNFKDSNVRKKYRIVYLVAVILCVLLGLASRKFGYLLSSFIAENAGDLLWAMMVYVGFRFMFVHVRAEVALALSLVFSFSIEFSQLYQANWINTIRDTTLGALILGRGFLVVDLVRYSVGIVFGWMVDRVWVKRIRGK